MQFMYVNSNLEPNITRDEFRVKHVVGISRKVLSGYDCTQSLKYEAGQKKYYQVKRKVTKKNKVFTSDSRLF